MSNRSENKLRPICVMSKTVTNTNMIQAMMLCMEDELPQHGNAMGSGAATGIDGRDGGGIMSSSSSLSPRRGYNSTASEAGTIACTYMPQTTPTLFSRWWWGRRVRFNDRALRYTIKGTTKQMVPLTVRDVQLMR